jgi:hypothetical protein
VQGHPNQREAEFKTGEKKRADHELFPDKKHFHRAIASTSGGGNGRTG